MKGSFVKESKSPVEDVVNILKETKADILINLIHTGSPSATKFYAKAALQANCSFINCIPTPPATNKEVQKKFQDKGLVLLGDDIKSQLGATILNRIILEFFKLRGIKITKSD